MEINTITQLARKVEKDSEFARKVAEDPAQVIRDVADDAENPAFIGDKWVYRIVVLALALILLIAAVGAIVLIWYGKSVPESIVALGSAAIGALAGLLAPSPTRMAAR